MEQYWTNRMGWHGGYIKFDTAKTLKPDERIYISIYRFFFYFSKLQTVFLVVIVVMLSLLTSADEIVSLNFFLR